MIKAIKMNNCVPYQHAEISDCKKINYIFGANGSGKSTIGSFLSGVTDSRFDGSSIEWTSEIHEKIAVYNKAFRIANLQQDMKGIFTLGNATIDDIKVLEQMKVNLERQTKDLDKYCSSLQIKETEKINKEKQFKENAWAQILKKNEKAFQKAFEGFRSSKDRFIIELNQRISDARGTVCKQTDLLRRAQTLYASKIERQSKFVLDIEKLMETISQIQNDSIWSTVIAGSKDVDIAALINELGNTSWVGQGRQYLHANSKKCPFCQQETITDEFRRKLESFFNTEYKQKTERLGMLQQEYQKLSNLILDLIEATVSGKDDSVQTGHLNLEVFTAKKDLLKATFISNTREMEKKSTKPEEKITISDVSSLVSEIRKMLDDANVLIDAHNALIDKRDTEEIVLRDDIWATCIHEADGFIKAYQRDISNINKALAGIKKARDSKKAEVDKLEFEVEEKAKHITSVRPAIDEINRFLKAYGFTDFSIQPAKDKENYYCITRDDGTLASNTLSEGEETFLTFLYFMQNAKGSTNQAHVADKKIIVLDDPISSLDSTILYVVGSIVKDLSGKIRKGEGDVTQLFVLTHNVFFHKEASFIDGRTKEISDVNYWIIRKNNSVAEIDAYKTKNPISSSYELLWRELKDNSRASLISVQNIMRRIIESYFGILGGRRDDCLLKKFENSEEMMIAKSLLYWINDGSHSIPDDLFIDLGTDIVPRYNKVFKDLFVKSGHLAHYNMMMGYNESDEKASSDSVDTV